VSPEPLQLTVLERWADDVLRFENFERYRTQSAMGVLPAREPMQTHDHGGPLPVVNFEDRRGF
jgi:hypothetical protein